MILKEEVLGRSEATFLREEKTMSRQLEEDEKACFLELGFPPQQRKSVVVVGYSLTSKTLLHLVVYLFDAFATRSLTSANSSLEKDWSLLVIVAFL